MTLGFVAVLAAIAALAAWFALKRRVWSISAAAVAAALAAIWLMVLAQGLPLGGPPPTPFILWAGAQGYAWVSPDRESPPRTYKWTPPADMMRELRKGRPLQVEGKKGKRSEQGNDPGGAQGKDGHGKQQPGGESSPSDAFWFTPLEPEHAQKD